MGMTFPVNCDNIDCRSIIFNSNVLFIPESLKRLRQSGINTIRLNITDEKPELIRELVRLYRTAADSFDEASSKYSGLIASIKEKGFTKGHLYRGV
jgi:putative protease